VVVHRAATRTVIHEAGQGFPHRFGLEIAVGYALPETPYGLIWPRGARPYETLGTPRQHPALGVINHARVAENGELPLRNPTVTCWNAPARVAKHLLPSGPGGLDLA
jgi:hypothetical protein